jgi:hypothetical protein
MRDGSGQIETDVPAMWGPAARAQTQSSPGASALAAPHQQAMCPRVRAARLRSNLLGVLEATILLGGFGGLVIGMYLLATRPLPGVMAMLASMTLLLSAVAKLGEVQEVRQECDADAGRYSRRRANGSG